MSFSKGDHYWNWLHQNFTHGVSVYKFIPFSKSDYKGYEQVTMAYTHMVWSVYILHTVIRDPNDIVKQFADSSIE